MPIPGTGRASLAVSAIVLLAPLKRLLRLVALGTDGLDGAPLQDVEIASLSVVWLPRAL
ncbi:hypothetical protein PD5205_00339 [Xanthomonas fragariae]|uniref:Uncharacterized protein n=1 Tax=Xanthomonas fragariae TaxID=48664 RepID=A0A1Y6GQI4_9XANT|nr:hypothetical protein NBC2815_00250 [Xanthomonas fragariae]SMR00891.1 hypothetical protein PD885_03670 [Xanthomonas fragariae]SMR01659.1 hypothetical protein PD5205_00339 [Xanthomonas fragariae]